MILKNGSQNVFFIFFLKTNRPRTRINAGSVGLSISECLCAKNIFLGVRVSPCESRFRDQRQPLRTKNPKPENQNENHTKNHH